MGIMKSSEEDANRPICDYKYAGFSDEELYMLKRQHVEADVTIQASSDYSEEEKETNEILTREIMQVIRFRGIAFRY